MGNEQPKLLSELEEILESKDLVSLEEFASTYPQYINAKIFEKGTNALCRATNLESMPMVQLLIKYGADVNLPSSNGNTPLMWAARNNDVPIMELLISHGVNIEARNKEGFSALDLAVANMSYKTALILHQKEAILRSSEEYKNLGVQFNIHKFIECLKANKSVDDMSIFFNPQSSNFLRRP
jgi:ankyrin repeat protein